MIKTLPLENSEFLTLYLNLQLALKSNAIADALKNRESLLIIRVKFKIHLQCVQNVHCVNLLGINRKRFGSNLGRKRIFQIIEPGVKKRFVG